MYKQLDDSKVKVTVVINDLWFFDGAADLKYRNDRDNFKDFDASKLGIKVLLFLQKNDEFIPLKKIDTCLIIKSPKYNEYHFEPNTLDKVISLLFQNIDSCIAQKVYEKKKHYSAKQFEDLLTTSHRKNIIDLSTLPKGIYKTYDDLLNKRPSLNEFYIEAETFEKIKKEKIAKKMDKVFYFHLLYEKLDAKNFFISRNNWGAFDGENLWITDGGFLCLLHKKNEDFYWSGFERAEGIKMATSLVFLTNSNGSLNPVSPVSVNISPEKDFLMQKPMHCLNSVTGRKEW